MTVVLGLLCKDGVVLGADGASSIVDRNLNIGYEKAKIRIWSEGNTTLGATAGSAEFGQSCRYGVKKLLQDSASPPTDVRAFGDAWSAFVRQDFEKWDLKFEGDEALIAVDLGKRPGLFKLSGCNMFPSIIQPEAWSQAIGNSSQIIESFFEFLKDTFWSDALPTVAAARLGATWAVQHTIETRGLGVNGPVNVGELRGGHGNRPYIAPRADIEECLEAMKDMLKQYLLSQHAIGRPKAPPTRELVWDLE